MVNGQLGLLGRISELILLLLNSIVSSESKGNYPLYEVKNFYKKILPNLGWKVERENLFSRGNENLELEFRSIKDETLIVFKIFPKY